MMKSITQYKGGSTALDGQAGNTVWFIGDNIILLVVPLVEFVILPLFPKLEYFLISPLKGIGLSMIFIICSMVCWIIMDLSASGDINCYSDWTPTDQSINTPFWITLIPSILAGIADMLSFIYIFAFLCSQAPSNMSGMLIGVFWFFRGVCVEASALFLIAFDHLPIEKMTNKLFSCTSLLMLLLGSTAIIGLLIYIFVAKWYTDRIRNEDLNLRRSVEEHFEHHILLSNNNRANRDYSTITCEGSTF